MKNLKQLTAITLCSVFAAMQVSYAAIDTGLGVGNGGAVINSTDANFAGMTTGVNSATLEFNGNSHVNWNTLNVNGNETLNFNGAAGKSGLTVLNTVNSGMSNIYGQIKTNDGIGKLIISNPNGVLFDGAKFTTAGDTMITTKNMTAVNVNSITDGTWGTLVDPATNDLVNVQILNNSDFGVGGQFTIVAPKIVGESSKINAGNGLKLITANGADYVAQGKSLLPNKAVTRLKAMDINGNVEVVNNIGALSISGTDIKGNLKAEVGGYGLVDGIYDNTTKALQKKTTITGDADLTAHNQQLIMRDVKVDGNVKMNNDSGAVELRNATVGKNADLTTTGWQPINHQKYNHYVHVSGNTDIGGDLNISSAQNVHIGNYEVTNNPYSTTSTVNQWAGNLLPGKLTVGGDIKAEVTDGGHIMTTIDTTAKNIDYTAKSHIEGTKTYGGNILSDGKAKITADTYKFKSDGYIGGLKASAGATVDDKIVHMMEEYHFIPDDTISNDYLLINGGTISKIDTPKTSAAGNDVKVYIKSDNDLLVNGANAGVVNLTAPDKKITVTGPNVHAKEINVDGRTGTLQLDFPNRDFTTHYTNIKDGVVKTIAPNEEITYNLTNAPTGYNAPDFQQTNGTNTTYLIGPDAPAPVNPPTDDNVRTMVVIPDDPTAPMASTPVAYAADLDDDDEMPCRKNVDGSVTVVRAYPMMN